VTVEHAAGRPDARLRGEVTGGTDWNLSAVF
jgi:hypothetical protein